MRLTNIAAQLGIAPPGKDLPGEYSNPRAVHQRVHGGWICVFLTSEQLDMKVTVNETKEAILDLRSQSNHLNVVRPRRVQAKIENPDGDGMLPLGDSIKGNRINMLVTPSSGTMVDFDWPRFIPLHTKRFYNGGEHDYNTLLMYSVGGDSMIDRAATVKAGAVRMLVCHNRIGCKRLVAVCRGQCIRDAQAASAKSRQWKRAREEMGGDISGARMKISQEGSRDFNSRVRMAHSAFGPRPEPTKNCDHYANGRCNRQKTCRMIHDPAIDPSTIPCRLDKRPVSGLCIAGADCPYLHE